MRITSPINQIFVQREPSERTCCCCAVSWLMMRSLEVLTSTMPWKARTIADEPGALVPPRSKWSSFRNQVKKSRASDWTEVVKRFLDAFDTACRSSCGLTWPLNRPGLHILRTSSPKAWTICRARQWSAVKQVNYSSLSAKIAGRHSRCTDGRAREAAVVGLVKKVVAQRRHVRESLYDNVEVVVGFDVVQTNEA